MYGYIYLVKNNINNKLYFGQTIRKFDERYRGGNIGKYTHNEHLKNAIAKYGIENFTLVKEFDHASSQEELDKLEDMYIKLYNTSQSRFGYNKRMGGANGSLSKETRNKLSVSHIGKHIGVKNSMYGKKHTEETKARMRDNHFNVCGSNNPNATKVFCVTTGEVFDCIADARMAYPSVGTNIPEACKGNLSFAGRTKDTKMPLQWLYYEDYIENNYVLQTIDSKYKPVYCITTNKYFTNAQEACDYYGMKSATGVKDCCRGKRKTAGKDPMTGEKLQWKRVE